METPDPTNALARTDRSRVRRHPERGSHERATAYAVIDEALVAHVGVVIDGAPVVIPTMHARLDDALYLHGAAANRMLRSLAEGGLGCATMTLVDGLVMARSAMYHSMNYRSVVVHGRGRVVEGEEKERALTAFIEKVEAGRSEQVRAPSPSELRATLVVALPIDEASLKARRGGPADPEDEPAQAVWTGVVPLVLTRGAPIAMP